MKSDTLFDLPPPQETRLEKIKRENGIWTHFSKADRPWSAWLMPEVKTHSEFMDRVSAICRVYDESGLVAFGNTEADAVFQLCKQMHIPCVL